MRAVANANVITFGSCVKVEGVDGVSPYSYELLPGGPGGSINPATGVYEAPGLTGIDTVRVTDDLGAQADIVIQICGMTRLICDVIKRELGLEIDQVYIYNQKFKVPNDERLYISVGVGSIKPFANNNRFVPTEEGGSSYQTANFRATLDINITSRSEAALNRKEEVLLALNSDYARNQQTINSFHIAPLTSQFNNLSELEGSAIPFRFNIAIEMQYAFRKVKATDYYDTFLDIDLDVNS